MELTKTIEQIKSKINQLDQFRERLNKFVADKELSMATGEYDKPKTRKEIEDMFFIETIVKGVGTDANTIGTKNG